MKVYPSISMLKKKKNHNSLSCGQRVPVRVVVGCMEDTKIAGNISVYGMPLRNQVLNEPARD